MKWQVEGMSVVFPRPFHPLEVVWYSFPSTSFSVDVMNWRNRTGFVCDFSDRSECVYACAATKQGTDYTNQTWTKDLTVLPPMKQSKLTSLLILAFLSGTSSISLHSSSDNSGVHTVIVDSFVVDTGYHPLTTSDLVRVNKVRQALSAISCITEFTGVLPESHLTPISQLIHELIHPTSGFAAKQSFQLIKSKSKSTLTVQPLYPVHKCVVLENDKPSSDASPASRDRLYPRVYTYVERCSSESEETLTDWYETSSDDTDDDSQGTTSN